MEIVERNRSSLTMAKDESKVTPTGGHSFFIQDILRPEFGNKQLKDQYLAYLHYYYALHFQNVMLMQNQQHLQRLQKERVELETMGLNVDASKLKNIQQNFACQLQSQRATLVRPTPVFCSAKSQLEPEVNFKNHREDRVLTKTPKSRGKSASLSSPGNERSFSLYEPTSPSISEASCGSSFFIGDVASPRRTNQKYDDANTQSPRLSGGLHGSVPSTPTKDSDKEGKGAKSTAAAGDPAQSEGSLWPAWVYCTRYSDRPSSGPRSRKIKRKSSEGSGPSCSLEKRPRIAFTNEQLSSLKREFEENRYLTEERRAKLAAQLDLTESQVKIWFQNKRAKLKKSSGSRNPLALQLMQQGLYNHATVPCDNEEDSNGEDGEQD